MGDERLVGSEVVDGVGYATLERDGRLNAFSLELAEELIAVLAGFRSDAAVRVVVIRGAGRVFSAGGDVKQMLDDVRRGDNSAYFRAPLSAFGRAVLAIRALPKPVIAAVHGAVAGFAWNLVLACDLVLARAGTRFTQAFIRLGLSPDGGGTHFLPRLVGYARACELAMLPGEIDAERARELGLVNWVVSAEDFAGELARITGALVRGPAPALARTKALFNRGLDQLAEHIEVERLAQVDNSASPDFGAGLAAFVERREADFADPPPAGELLRDPD